MLTIKPVHTRAELSAFIKTPRLIYQGMPGYEPPLDLERRHLLDPKKSRFFEHGEAQYWMAYREGRAVGRISAQVDRLGVETWGESIGNFGCLDAADDPEAVAALCETAAAWLKGRGMVRMRGPFLLSINGETGLQVEGQEHGGMVLMPWHPRYLGGLVEGAGLAPTKDLLAFTVPRGFRPNEELMALAKGRLPASFSLRHLDLNNLEREGSIMQEVFNDAWKGNWGFVPMTKTEVTTFVKSFRPYLIPECGFIAEIDGKPVAFFVALPNLIDAMRGLDGQLLPFNWLKFLVRTHRTQTYRSARIALFGVASKLHGLGGAVVFAMLDALERKAQSDIFSNAATLEMSWVLEDNRPVIALMHAFGVTAPSKRYRVYEKQLI